jgi:hypothetical protein
MGHVSWHCRSLEQLPHMVPPLLLPLPPPLLPPLLLPLPPPLLELEPGHVGAG